MGDIQKKNFTLPLTSGGNVLSVKSDCSQEHPGCLNSHNELRDGGAEVSTTFNKKVCIYQKLKLSLNFLSI